MPPVVAGSACDKKFTITFDDAFAAVTTKCTRRVLQRTMSFSSTPYIYIIYIFDVSLCVCAERCD